MDRREKLRWGDPGDRSVQCRFCIIKPLLRWVLASQGWPTQEAARLRAEIERLRTSNEAAEAPAALQARVAELVWPC